MKHIVTDDDIRALATEAGSAGDLEMVRICAAALAGSEACRLECEVVILGARMRGDEDSKLFII